MAEPPGLPPPASDVTTFAQRPADHVGVGDGVTERPLVGDSDTECDIDCVGDAMGDSDGVIDRPRVGDSDGDGDGVTGGQVTGPAVMTRTRLLSKTKM